MTNAEMLDLKRKGWTCKEIAEASGIHYSSVAGRISSAIRTERPPLPDLPERFMPKLPVGPLQHSIADEMRELICAQMDEAADEAKADW